MSTTAALVEGHYIATESMHRPNGVIVHQAGCQCGAQFEWNDRDKAHALHLLDVVRADHEKAVRERIAVQRDALYAVLWGLDQKGLLPPCNDMTDGNGACTVCTAMESAANDGAHARIAREGA